jgi:hypothetical protein
LLLDLGLVILNLKPVQCGKDVFAVFHPTFRDQVARGFREITHPDDDHDTKYDLKSNGKSPGQVRRAVVTSEINPVRDQGSDGNHTALNADQQAAVAGLGAFGLVRGDSRGIHSVPDAGDGSAEYELKEGEMTGERSDLDDDADDHHAGPDDDHHPPTQTVPEDQSEDCTE